MLVPGGSFTDVQYPMLLEPRQMKVEKQTTCMLLDESKACTSGIEAAIPGTQSPFPVVYALNTHLRL